MVFWRNKWAFGYRGTAQKFTIFGRNHICRENDFRGFEGYKRFFAYRKNFLLVDKNKNIFEVSIMG